MNSTRTCLVPHAHEAQPAFRDTPEALRTCARDGCSETFRLRWPSDEKRFCSHVCSAASRRQDTCARCGGDDWLVKASGKRACRTCRNRSRGAWERKQQAKRVQAPTPALPRPAYRDTPEALRTCAYDGCTETFRARGPSDPTRYHSRDCAYAAARVAACGVCGANDWYTSVGKRSCRPCHLQAVARYRAPEAGRGRG